MLVGCQLVILMLGFSCFYFCSNISLRGRCFSSLATASGWAVSIVLPYGYCVSMNSWMIPFSPDEGDFGTFALFVIYMLLSFFALFFIFDASFFGDQFCWLFTELRWASPPMPAYLLSVPCIDLAVPENPMSWLVVHRPPARHLCAPHFESVFFSSNFGAYSTNALFRALLNRFAPSFATLLRLCALACNIFRDNQNR